MLGAIAGLRRTCWSTIVAIQIILHGSLQVLQWVNFLVFTISESYGGAKKRSSSTALVTILWLMVLLVSFPLLGFSLYLRVQLPHYLVENVVHSV